MPNANNWPVPNSPVYSIITLHVYFFCLADEFKCVVLSTFQNQKSTAPSNEIAKENQAYLYKRLMVMPFLTSSLLSGEQSSSHSATTCCLFATRKMQCHSGKEIQWGKVRSHSPIVALRHTIETLLSLNLQMYWVFFNCSPLRHPELAAVCRDSRTLILYPGPKSQNLDELVQHQEVGTVTHNVIIIDGTWSQAKNMFLKNSLFHLPKQVCTV